MRHLSAILFAGFMGVAVLSALAQEPAPPGKADELMSHELAWKDPARIADPKFRVWMKATVFAEFKFSGTFDEAITRLMTESSALTPDGKSVGGFIMKTGVPTEKQIQVDVRQMNALQLINALCSACGVQWTLSPFSIIVSPLPPGSN